MLPFALSGECLELITWRDSEVTEFLGCVQLKKLAKSDTSYNAKALFSYLLGLPDISGSSPGAGGSDMRARSNQDPTDSERRENDDDEAARLEPAVR